MPTIRSYIDEIKIQNFKFFPKMETPIKVGGNHVLLYGENGSGKSSIYWALYTLLECANKEELEEIQKYFNPEKEERLTNIHLKPGTNNWVIPFIEISLMDGSKPFHISFDDTTINANREAQESNFSSDFINYRNLLNLYNFAHSEYVDLIWYFNYAVFPYVKFPDVKIGTISVDGTSQDKFENSSNKLFKLVNEGPKKDQKTKQRKDRFPKLKEPSYKDYKQIVDGFKSGLEALLRDINSEGNMFLKEDLGYNFGFELTLDWQRHIIPSKRKLNSNDKLITVKRFPNKIVGLKETDFAKEPFLINDQVFVKPQFKIWLNITDYENEKNAVIKPHSFLNEARLTALGLSLRLAVLKRSLSEDAKLKILVLDDLLISLDMSNREKVLELILKRYQAQYQLFIFTHDRAFFNITKKKIELEHDTTKWVFYDLFETRENEISKPLLRPSKDPLAIAKDHFNNNDYAATVNYQRSFIEGWFINFIPELKLKYEAKKGKELFSVKMLEGLIVKAETYFDEIGFEKDILNKIRLYKDLLLNPLSHHDNGKSDLYKKEVADIFEFINYLLKLNNKPLIKVNQLISYKIKTQEGSEFIFTLKLLNDFRYYKQFDTDYSVDRKISVQIISVLKDTVLQNAGTRELKNKTLIELYNDGCFGITKFENQKPIIEAELDLVFKTAMGKSLREIINEILV